jgi:cytochrome b561
VEFTDLVTSSACQYDRTQRFFHWPMAALIFTAIALGIWAYYLDRNSPLKGSVHKSLGLTVLILTIARVAHRLGE